MTTLPLRDRRHQQAKQMLARLETQRDATLDKLTRIAARLKATRRSIERYERTPTSLPAPRPVAVPAAANVEPPTLAPAPASGSIDIADLHTSNHPVAKANAESWGAVTGKPKAAELEIPEFCKRLPRVGEKSAADLAAIAEIEAQQAEQKKRKRESKGAVPPSRKLGPDAQKMPLTGKAAMAFLKTGKRSENRTR